MSSIERIATGEDMGRFAQLGPEWYKVAEFAVTSKRTRAAFADLVLDPYAGEGRGKLSGGRHRHRRYDVVY